MQTTIRKIAQDIPLSDLLNSCVWQQADVLDICCYNWSDRDPDSLPRVRAELLYSDAGLYARYTVQEKTIRAVHFTPNDPVCQDSCVELFISPDWRIYFNFETNCAGTLLLFSGTERRNRIPVPLELRKDIDIVTSLASGVSVENQPCPPDGWKLAMRVPLALFSRHTATDAPCSGTQWKGNLYKCGDLLPEPHWASWAPIQTEKPDFHRPEFFGTFIFE